MCDCRNKYTLLYWMAISDHKFPGLLDPLVSSTPNISGYPNHEVLATRTRGEKYEQNQAPRMHGHRSAFGSTKRSRHRLIIPT